MFDVFGTSFGKETWLRRYLKNVTNVATQLYCMAIGKSNQLRYYSNKLLLRIVETWLIQSCQTLLNRVVLFVTFVN